MGWYLRSVRISASLSLCRSRPGQLRRHRDSLRARRSNPAPIQTGTVTHPAYYTPGTRSFLGVKRSGRGVDHPPSSSAEVRERVELYFNSPWMPSLQVIGRTLLLSLSLTASTGFHETVRLYKKHNNCVRALCLC